jgi:hypothetical protein
LRELATLNHLEGLHLTGTKVTDAGLREIAGFKKLRTLTLYDTGITDAGLENLHKALPQCSISAQPFERRTIGVLGAVILGIAFVLGSLIWLAGRLRSWSRHPAPGGSPSLTPRQGGALFELVWSYIAPPLLGLCVLLLGRVISLTGYGIFSHLILPFLGPPMVGVFLGWLVSVGRQRTRIALVGGLMGAVVAQWGTVWLLRTAPGLWPQWLWDWFKYPGWAGYARNYGFLFAAAGLGALLMASALAGRRTHSSPWIGAGNNQGSYPMAFLKCLYRAAGGGLQGSIVGVVLFIWGLAAQGLIAFTLLPLGVLLAVFGSCIGAIIGAALWTRQTQLPVASFRQVAIPALCSFLIPLMLALFFAWKMLQTPGPHHGPFHDL